MDIEYRKPCSDLLVHINDLMWFTRHKNEFHLQEIQLSTGRISILLLDGVNPLTSRLSYKHMYDCLVFLWDLCETITVSA